MSALLNSLQSQLRNMRNRASDLNANIHQLNARLAALRTVRTNLSNTVNNNVSSINNNIRSIERDIVAGINFPGREQRLASIFAGRHEGNITDDHLISPANSFIVLEINNIEDQIGTARTSLGTVNNEVSRLEREIRAEQTRINNQNR